MRTVRSVWLIALCLLSLSPSAAISQSLPRVAFGGAVGVAGGVAVTLAAITARAHFQNEYLHAPEDLIHWQSTPMIAAPAAGAFFGWAGEEELRASIVGSVSGLVVGAGIGAGIGWLLSEQPESPWAGAIIGGGAGVALGGLLGGLLAWRRDESGDGKPQTLQVMLLQVAL